MKRLIIAFLATFTPLVMIDFVWLSFTANTLYRPVIADMLIDQFRIAPAIAFYLTYAAGLVFFAVRPALDEGRCKAALIPGAMLGLVAYATYDLTNQATLKYWSTLLTLTDICWGITLSATASAIGCKITKSIVERSNRA